MGAGLIIAGQLGLVIPDDVPESVGVIYDGVVALLTAFGVFQVPNDPAVPARSAPRSTGGFEPDGVHRI